MKDLFAAALASLLCLCPAQAGLVEIENQFRAAYELGVGAKHAAAVSDLDVKYAGALERAMQESTKAGKLEEALALKQELARVTGKQPLPETDEGADPAVAKFRGFTGANSASSRQTGTRRRRRSWRSSGRPWPLSRASWPRRGSSKKPWR